jgi:hypothetical protein
MHEMLPLSTFRARVFWSLIPIFCVLVVFIGFVDLYEQKQLAEDEVNWRARSMAENLAYSSRLAVLTEDKRLLEAALHSVTGAADFAYVFIYGEKWTPLVQAAGKSVDIKRVNRELEAKQKEFLVERSDILFNSSGAGSTRYIEYVAPVTSSRSTAPYELQIQPDETAPAGGKQKWQQTIGAVRLGLSTSRVDAHVASFLKWRGWSVVLFLSLSTMAVYVFSVRITHRSTG